MRDSPTQRNSGKGEMRRATTQAVRCDDLQARDTTNAAQTKLSPSARGGNGATERARPKRRIGRLDQYAVIADRELFFRTLAPEAPRQTSWIFHLHSAAIARQRVQAHFMELFFSKDGTRFAGFEYILRSAPASQALTHALDATCLVHVGNASKDMRTREAARRTYGLAIMSLRSELANPDRNPSQLLAVMHLLLICELFSDIAAPDGMGARRHVRGMMQMLEYIKPSLLDPDVRTMLGTQFNGVATWDAVFERKSLRGFKNLEESLADGTTFSSATDVVSAAVRVPAVLEHAGKVTRMGSAASVESIIEAINDIVAIEGELQISMTKWYNRLDGQPYRTAAISQMPGLDSCFYDRSGIFSHTFVFGDALSCPKQRSYWILLLVLTQGHLKLCEAHPGLLILQSGNNDIQRLNAKAYEYADSICMSIAADLVPKNGYAAFTSAIFPLQIAMHWYGRKRDIPKLAWCQKALTAFQAAGISPPYMSSCAQECLSHLNPTI